MAEGYASNPTRGGRGRGGGGGGGGGGRGGRGSSSSSRGRNGQSQQQEQGAIPAGSVSKLKAQIRQTKRLLAREDLTPDVRTTTERRMVALESELEKTSQSKVEKKMVQRYRGVKFFERQKLLRKIKQAKKQLAEVPESADAQRALLEARIDLYYVLRYPRSEKYIALFPDGTYVPPLASLSELASDAAPSERKRQTLRISLRDQVKRGELPAEAELGELGIEGEEDVGSGPATTEKKRERADEAEKENEEEEEEEREQAAKQDEEQGSDERPTKRIRSAEGEEEEAADVSTGAKKEKENRKQRKERKRAEAEAAQATTTPSSATATAAAKGASGKKKGSVGSGKKAASAGGAADLVAEDDFFA